MPAPQPHLVLNLHPSSEIHLLATESWTEAGSPAADDRETDTVEFYHGVPIEIETTHNGQPLSARAAARQQHDAARTRRAIDAVCHGDGDDGRLVSLAGEVWTMDQFIARFRWSPDPAVAGRWHFVSAPGLAIHTRLERILSHTAGTFDIDPSSGQILDGDFHSTGPVSFGGGLLAHFSSFQGRFRLQPDDNGWVMRQVVVTVSGRELLHHIRGTETMTYAIVPERATIGAGNIGHGHH